jgi:hypothetical protein
MDCKESVMERTDVDEQRPLFPRNAIDPDAALVEQLREGDAGAAEALVDAYGDRVYRLAIRITGNASDAEEVVQDTLWTVSRKIDSFRGAAAFRSWLYRSPPTPPIRRCGGGEAGGTRCRGTTSLRHSMRRASMRKCRSIGRGD